MTERLPQESWGYLIDNPNGKYHYFVRDKLLVYWTLCGGSSYHIRFFVGSDDHPNNCKTCMKVLAKRKP